MYRPLADKIRPATLEHVVGQEHILGPGKVLRRIIESGQIPNMIFYGPSGSGKTTVANIIAAQTNRALHRLNATSASIADIKQVISELDSLLAPQGALVYLDEIQYFNKKQQQSLLEFVENGKITLIASTTENPYFYVYNALLSRSTVFEFKQLDQAAILPAVERAFEMATDQPLDLDPQVCTHIASACGGDVRKAINAVELLTLSAVRKKGKLVITLDDAKEIAQKSAFRYDRDGDSHYDILSAYQKSMRGSDPDAAVHYLARLLHAGDLVSACRRLLVTVCEDVSLAYPGAVSVVKACVDTAMQVGLPEAGIPLAQAVIFVATAPKSNSAVNAYFAALGDIESGIAGDVPEVLKDTHYKGAQALGRGQGYKYSHNYKNSYIKQQFLPDAIKDAKYYEFGQNKVENALRDYWERVKAEAEKG